MRFGRNSETYGIDASNQRLPIRDCPDVVLLRDFICARVIDIAHADELRTTFIGERRMNARMLLSQMSDANDCGS